MKNNFWKEQNILSLLNLVICFILILVCISLNELNTINYLELEKQKRLNESLIKTDSIILTKYLNYIKCMIN